MYTERVSRVSIAHCEKLKGGLACRSKLRSKILRVRGACCLRLEFHQTAVGPPVADLEREASIRLRSSGQGNAGAPSTKANNKRDARAVSRSFW